MPFFNPFREDRLRRMRELLSTLERIKECDLDWLLGWGGLKWGSTEESLMRMINQLEKARMVEIVGSELRKVRYIGIGAEEEKKEETTTK